MTDEFLTQGLQGDRYLKALRLVNQFEEEIEAILLDFDQRMVDAHPEFFDPNTGPNVKTNQSTSGGLANHRINHRMEGLTAEDSRTPRLNVHLYWMPPTEYGRTDIEGALRGFGYKIKYGDEAVDTQIAEQTRAEGWDVDTSSNPYDSNIVFYRHVSSAEEIEATADTLVQHFSEFGEAYGTPESE